MEALPKWNVHQGQGGEISLVKRFPLSFQYLSYYKITVMIVTRSLASCGHPLNLDHN